MSKVIILGITRVLVLGVALVCAVTAASAQQAWPNRPIKLIVPYPAGGNADSIGRLIGEKISGPLGQPIVVENRAGAGATIGAGLVARSTADGYTLLIPPAAVLTITHHLRQLPYNPETDFAPIAQLSSGYFIVAARKDLPANNWPELVALAKKEPGKLTFGSAGIATVSHLMGEISHKEAGIKLLHVPYKGSAESLSDLIGGRIDLMYDPVSLAQIKAGNAKALAVLANTRHPELPNVPTLKEQGLAFQSGTWFGLVAPRGTPPEIVQRIAAEAKKALAAPGVKERMVQFSQYPDFLGPDEFAKQIRADNKFFKDLIKDLDIKIQ
jgi:tripartite-type tricarboxylate transporter receptor subunit TctC